MIANYINGFKYAFKGFSLISKTGVRRYAIVPLLVNTLLFSVAVYVGFQQFGGWMNSFLGGISWLPDMIETAITWVLWPLFAILIIIATYYSFTMIANLIAAPFNAMLSYKVEQYLRGSLRGQHGAEQDSTEQDSASKQEMNVVEPTLASVASRSIGSEVKKIIHMLKWLIVLLIITVIPGVNLVAPFAWMIYGAWMLSLEYMDYPMSNHEMYFKEEISLLKRNRFLSLGFGSGVMLLTLIPVVNFFAMPVSVASSTALWVDRLSEL